MKPIGIFACFLVLAPVARAQRPACSNRQTEAQIAARIDALIGKMTLEERVAQLQDRAPAIPRLGLPGYNWWNEGLHGIARNGYATVFPQAIGLAATWDPSLMHQVGDTVSTEARAKFDAHAHRDSERFAGLTIWSPNINIFRDPRWGRGQETYGEDPFLTMTLGTQFVEGVQGNDPFYFKAQATPKHFVAHSGPEEGRDSFNTVVSEHDMADTYLPAFHQLLTKGGAAAVMCSYNAINGIPSCANRALLQDLVSDKWGFRGYVVSDCDAVGNITEYQHYANDAAHGAADALNAGVDLDCGDSYLALADALKQGLVKQQDIDASLHRLLLARVQLGLFDDGGCTPYNRIAPAENDTPAHRALALRAAEESVVLLKNDGMLPLHGASSVAVIGPNADSVKVLEANYHGTASVPVTPLDGLRKAYAQVRYAQGSLLAAGVAEIVPRTALRTGVAPDAAAGLTAEYFNGDTVEGMPTVTTLVPKIDLDVDRVSPSPLLTSSHYAARWSGYFVPPVAGDYVLEVNIKRCWDCDAHDGFRLLFDGKTVLADAGSKTEHYKFPVSLKDTAPHALRLELDHGGEDAGIGLEWEPPAEALIDEAVAAAKASDAVVVFAGLSPELEGEALQVHLQGFNGGDRTSLDLPLAQRTLIARLRELHKPMTVVLDSGSAVALGPESLGADAVLAAWYPGEEGGDALANVLSGKTSPSGRLPVTFYRSTDDLPAFTDYSMAHRTYRYFTGPVEFGFGYGLSYAKFKYGPVRLASATIGANETLRASVTVTNTSSIKADEVAELYLIPPTGLAGAPRLALAGTQRVTLAPGESKTLRFTLGDERLSTVDPQGRRSVRQGLYRVAIGGAQPQLGGKTTAGTAFRIVAARPHKRAQPDPEDQDDSRPGLVRASLAINSPKSELAQANQGRENRAASSLK
jgi:beta-glucosidase